MMTPNTYVCPLFFEPVQGAGDRFAVGALVRDVSGVYAQRIIREDSLGAMYGKKGNGLAKLIEHGLLALSEIAKDDLDLSSVPSGIMGLIPGKTHFIYSASTKDALRTCVLMYSSLGNLEEWDEDEDEDEGSGEETAKTFYTQVRDSVIGMRGNLKPCFGQKVPLLEGGRPTKFGFRNEKTILHFGVLSPNNQGYGLRDAQAKLWQLRGASDYAQIPDAALIYGVPHSDDVTISDKLRNALNENIREIEKEADNVHMRFISVTSINEAALLVLSRAA